MPNDTGAYDILVWIDGDGDVVCKDLTPAGLRCLQRIHPTYNSGQILQILCTPEAFAEVIPEDVLVGLQMHPSKRVVAMGRPQLH